MPPPPRDYTVLKMEYNGKGVLGGGGSSVLRNLNQEAAIRGTCVLEVIGIIFCGI